jgi:hypothetical protein
VTPARPCSVPRTHAPPTSALWDRAVAGYLPPPDRHASPLLLSCGAQCRDPPSPAPYPASIKRAPRRRWRGREPHRHRSGSRCRPLHPVSPAPHASLLQIEPPLTSPSSASCCTASPKTLPATGAGSHRRTPPHTAVVSPHRCPVATVHFRRHDIARRTLHPPLVP